MAEGLLSRAGLCLREGPTPPSLVLNLSLFLPLPRPWGTGWEHLVSLQGRPCDAMGLMVADGVSLPLGLPAATRLSPTSRRPSGTAPGFPGPLCQHVSVFVSFFLSFKVCSQRKDHLYWSDVASLGWQHRPWSWWFRFSIRTFLLSWSQPRAHSILLFVDFWAHVFYGH